MPTNFPTSLDSLTNPAAGDTLASPSHSGQHADANDAIEALQAKVGVNGSAVATSIDYKLNNTVATLTGTQTLTNKTLTTPVLTRPLLVSPEEKITYDAGVVPGGTMNFDVLTQGVLFYAFPANNNQVVNIRGDSGTTLASILAVGESVTIGYIFQNSSTGYYVTSVQIDGSTSGVFTRWQGGTAPTSGNSNSFDVYVFTVMRTGSSTYQIFASQTKFA